MSKPGVAHDQTVEEILASIRQVISSDQARRAASPANAAAAAAPTGSRPTVVTAIAGGRPPVRPEPTRPVAEASEAGPAVSAVDRSEIHDGVELAIEQALEGVDPDEIRAETAAQQRQPAAHTAPHARAVVPPRLHAAELPRPEPEPPPPMPAPEPSRGLLSPRANAAVAASFDDLAREIAARGIRDVDQTVEDLLRPMLRAWLDDNLPLMVERLVREEIERVSRGRR